MLSFTGSTETGRRFLKYSADSNLKKIVLECGGKNPAIVLEDAEDLDLVAAHIVNGAFWNMGENCSACSRLIVHEAIKRKDGKVRVCVVRYKQKNDKSKNYTGGPFTFVRRPVQRLIVIQASA